MSDPIADLLKQKAQEAVARNAMQAGLAGLGIGVGARGLQGLLNQWHRAFTPVQTVRKPSIVDLPVPAEDKDEKFAREKHSESRFDSAMNMLMHPVKTVGGWVSGEGATTASDMPFGMIPSVIAGAGGIAGGWKGLDMLLDRARERELAVQEQKAREEYEQALSAQSKVGQALHAELDLLYTCLDTAQRDEIEKTANTFSTLTNMYGIWALLSGVPAGVWAYEATKARHRSSLLESARKKYRRTREAVRPTPVYVRPVPIQEGSSMQSAPSDEELEGSPLDKAAGQGLILAFAR